MTRRPRGAHGAIAVAMLAAASLFALSPAPAAAQANGTAKSFAQKLVDAARARHPEADEIGILAMTAKGCYGIASTDKSDIGERCEADDMGPMKTGKPSVDKEGRGFDVSVLLHDATGKTVGVLAVGFKGAPGRTTTTVKRITARMESEMAAKISSKAMLLQGWK